MERAIKLVTKEKKEKIHSFSPTLKKISKPRTDRKTKNSKHCPTSRNQKLKKRKWLLRKLRQQQQLSPSKKRRPSLAKKLSKKKRMSLKRLLRRARMGK